WIAAGAAPEHVDVSLERRHRRAQLVRRVIDESAHLCLGLALRGKRRLDAVGHVVEALRQQSDLVRTWVQAAARAQVSRGELLGGVREPAQRAQRASGERESEEQGDDEHGATTERREGDL